jgi:hypothetical protein
MKMSRILSRSPLRGLRCRRLLPTWACNGFCLLPCALSGPFARSLLSMISGHQGEVGPLLQSCPQRCGKHCLLICGPGNRLILLGQNCLKLLDIRKEENAGLLQISSKSDSCPNITTCCIWLSKDLCCVLSLGAASPWPASMQRCRMIFLAGMCFQCLCAQSIFQRLVNPAFTCVLICPLACRINLASAVFIWCYAAEAAIKITGLGLQYFREGWNIFDLVSFLEP